MKQPSCFFGCFCLLFSIVIVLPLYTKAQSPGTSNVTVSVLKMDRLTSNKDLKTEEKWQLFKRNRGKSVQEDDLYTLPVVFHIIHQNGEENIPDAVVMDAFQRLNDAFANRGIYDQGSGIDTRIQFCMAKKDPDGNYTTGITRTYADLPKVNPAVHHSLLESLIKWDPDRYINIWVVKKVDLLIEFNRCGYDDLFASGYGGGGMVVAEAGALPAIIVHEMGHALGLDHTFTGWCTNNNCLTDGDGICDTPPEQTISIIGGCTSPENSCHTDTQSGFSTDVNDLKTNHMDYGNQSCQHDFTAGQKDKMRFVIETQHPGFLTADVCTNDCTNPAEAEFSFAALPEYSIGTTVNFTNTSTGASSYEWKVNNSPVSSATDLSFTFPGQGWYKTELLAKPSPDEVKCRNKQINWIRVYCSIKSVVAADKRKAVINETIRFTSTITPVISLSEPVTYEWYQNGVLFGNTQSFNYSFTTPGVKIFYLVTIQGSCRDTSLADMVDIKPAPDYTLNLKYPVCVTDKAEKIRFSICNDGYAAMPAGVPVTFYDGNPQTTNARRVGGVFYTNKNINPFCCEDFEFDLPGSYTGAFIFGVVNDDNSIPTPYSLANDFPVTSFPETNYTNNADSLSLAKFSVTITPGEATVLVGQTVQFTATANQPASFTWSSSAGTFSCDTCAVTGFSPKRYSRVILKAVSEGGCLASDTAFVKVLANGEVYIPSAFTPNNDDLNDFFYILGGADVANVSSFQVFNRWGELVFSKQNTEPNIPRLGWDGTVKGQVSGSAVYVYSITVRFNDHTSKQYKGTITLIR